MNRSRLAVAARGTIRREEGLYDAKRAFPGEWFRTNESRYYLRHYRNSGGIK